MENGMPIKTWIDDMKDRELYNYIPLLEYLYEIDNIQETLPLMITNNEIDYNKCFALIKSHSITKEKEKEKEKETKSKESNPNINIKIINHNVNNYIVNNTSSGNVNNNNNKQNSNSNKDINSYNFNNIKNSYNTTINATGNTNNQDLSYVNIIPSVKNTLSKKYEDKSKNLKQKSFRESFNDVAFQANNFSQRVNPLTQSHQITTNQIINDLFINNNQNKNNNLSYKFGNNDGNTPFRKNTYNSIIENKHQQQKNILSSSLNSISSHRQSPQLSYKNNNEYGILSGMKLNNPSTSKDLIYKKGSFNQNNLLNRPNTASISNKDEGQIKDEKTNISSHHLREKSDNLNKALNNNKISKNSFNNKVDNKKEESKYKYLHNI
jgi:hypothetical protein